MKLLLTISLFIFIAFNLSSQTCGVRYATPTGNGTGAINAPSSLENALISSNPGDIIRIAIGTYALDNPLNLVDGVTLEGGFDPSNGWSKTSLAGATTINRTTANPEGPGNAPRLVAFYGSGITNFRLQDLTISTDNAINERTSTYAVHLDNCSEYTITRCQLLPGNAGNGQNGTNGNNGINGATGINGQNGNNDNEAVNGGGGNGGNGGGTTNGGAGGACCNTTAYDGANGGAPSGIFGGGGAGGASGGGEDRDGGIGGNGGGALGAGGSPGQESGCNSGITCGSSESGGDAANGSSGSNGSNGTNGPVGNHVSGFWTPGSQAGNGTNGTGGAGGGGGGGGAGEGGTFCIDGKGSGGGGGGGGGQAGTAGTGGTGGGSSYGLYLVNNGINGIILQSHFNAGTLGSGGLGGNGGSGGLGGQGGNGATYTGSEVGCGGDGGNGGNAGNGGDGGNGTPGQSLDVYLNSGDPLSTSDVTFNLVAQPVIVKDSINCEGRYVQFNAPGLPSGVPGAGLGVADWDFDVNSNEANPATGVNNPDTTMYNAPGRFTVSLSGEIYEGFVNITPSQTVNAGTDQQLCDVTTSSLTGVSSGTDITWTSLGAASIDDATNLNTGIQNLQPGANKFVLSTTGCCPADPDTVTVILGNETTAVDVISSCGSYKWIDGNTYTSSNNTATYSLTNAAGCDSIITLDLTINTVNNTVSQNGITLTADLAGAAYQWLDCDNNNTPMNGETNQSFTAALNGNYAVEINQNGCIDTSDCYLINSVGLDEYDFGNTVTLFPNPTDGDFSIDLGKKYNSVDVTIYDIYGKLIATNIFKESQLLQLKIKDIPGVYLIVVKSEEQKAVFRLIKN